MIEISYRRVEIGKQDLRKEEWKRGQQLYFLSTSAEGVNCDFDSRCQQNKPDPGIDPFGSNDLLRMLSNFPECYKKIKRNDSKI